MRAHRLFTISAFASTLPLLAACMTDHDDAPRAAAETSSALAPSCALVTVNLDGSFSPSSLSLAEGSCVKFQGPGGAPLRTTDSVVRVTQTALDLAQRSGTSCMVSGVPYDTSTLLPGDANELTGPLRRGTSGIYALGPEASDGFYEGPAGDTCAAIGAAAGSAPAIAGVEEWRAEEISGAATKLCRKYNLGDLADPDDDKVSTTNNRFILQSTWDNPDLAGAVVRINWRDLYAKTDAIGAGGLPLETYAKDYSRLDAELNEAAKRGKLVLLDVMAGDGIPEWIFQDYATLDSGGLLKLVDASQTGIAARSVVPIETSDFGTNPSTNMPTAKSCGYKKTMGSPADPAYKAAVLAMLRDVAAHIRQNGSHYQALASFKVTGLNFLTGEMRLPKRCLDPKATNDNGNPQTKCWCNTRIWAAPLGTKLPAYVDPDPRDDVTPDLVTGGGYTHAAAQSFMNAVENALYEELGKRKSMHFMLIQDGFPKVLDSTHYDTDAPTSSSPWAVPGPLGPVFAPNFGYPLPYDQQTQDALDNGQAGGFRLVNPDGSPAPTTGDADAHSLFAVMHAGLRPIPPFFEVGEPATCKQDDLPEVLVNGKYEAPLHAPNTYGGTYGGAGHCPNTWAVREGFEGQVSGFQTVNSLATSDELSAALWNATLNSNAVFLEAYELVLWRAEQERRLGNAVLSKNLAGHALDPRRQKSLAQWADELHRRRRALEGYAPNDRHMKDPFPPSYTFTFKKHLAPGVVERYHFINPGARCGAGTFASGRIDVTGT